MAAPTIPPPGMDAQGYRTLSDAQKLQAWADYEQFQRAMNPPAATGTAAAPSRSSSTPQQPFNPFSTLGNMFMDVLGGPPRDPRVQQTEWRNRKANVADVPAPAAEFQQGQTVVDRPSPGPVPSYRQTPQSFPLTSPNSDIQFAPGTPPDPQINEGGMRPTPAQYTPPAAQAPPAQMWEVEINGQRYQVEAPDQDTAIQAAQRWAATQQQPQGNQPLLPDAVEHYQQGQQQEPLIMQPADPNWQPPPLGEGIRQLGDVGGQMIEGAGAAAGNMLRGATVGAFEQGNAGIAGLGGMLFNPEHNFTDSYRRSLENQRALMAETPEPLRQLLEMTGAAATALLSPAMVGGSLGRQMAVGAGLGAGGAFQYPLATGQGDMQDAVRGAGIGAAIGAAAPPFFAMGGALGRKVGSMFSRGGRELVSELPESAVAWARQADLNDLEGGAIVRNAPRPEQFGGSDISADYINASRDYYRAVGNRMYELADQAGIQIPTQSVMDALQPLEQQFARQFDPELASSLTNRLNHAREILSSGETVPISELERWRQSLARDIRSAQPGSNAQYQLTVLRDTVDDQIDAASAAYPAARELWGTVKQLDVLENLSHRATANSANASRSYEDAFMNELTRIYRSRNAREWGVFSPEQQQAIADAVNASGPLRGINSFLSKIFPNDLSRIISGGVGVLSGNPLGMAPVIINAADRATTGAARNRALSALMDETIPRGTTPGWQAPPPQFQRPAGYATIPAALIGGARTGGGF